MSKKREAIVNNPKLKALGILRTVLFKRIEFCDADAGDFTQGELLNGMDGEGFMVEKGDVVNVTFGEYLQSLMDELRFSPDQEHLKNLSQSEVQQVKDWLGQRKSDKSQQTLPSTATLAKVFGAVSAQLAIDRAAHTGAIEIGEALAREKLNLTGSYDEGIDLVQSLKTQALELLEAAQAKAEQKPIRKRN